MVVPRAIQILRDRSPIYLHQDRSKKTKDRIHPMVPVVIQINARTIQIQTLPSKGEHQENQDLHLSLLWSREAR
jgi:hypothetical protein